MSTTQFDIALSAADLNIQLALLNDSLSALRNCFHHYGLALSSTKSESILFGTHQRLRYLSCYH